MISLFNIKLHYSILCALGVALFILPACVKTDEASGINNEFGQETDIQRVITDAVNDMWLTIHSDTKSDLNEAPKILSIAPIAVPTTKSGKADTQSSYVVNFTNEEGFAVVTMDEDECPNVLALTESGTLNKDMIFNPNARFNSDGETVVYKYIENMILDERHERAILDKKLKGDSPDGWGGPYVWYLDTIVHPIVHVKWGQEYPFNMCMPLAPSTAPDVGPTTGFRGRYAVGCSIIAAMQIAAATEHPYSFTLNNNQTIDTYMFSSVSFYGNYTQYNPENYDSCVSDSMKEITETLAQLFYEFAEMYGAIYNSNGSTSLSIVDAMNYLDYLDHNRYGAFDLVECPSYLFFNVYNIISMINAGKPLIVKGEGYDFYLNPYSHAWVLDGYLKQYRIGLDDDRYTRTLVHFNWGYHGLYDGYYYNTTISNRYSIDESYDPDTTPTTWIDVSYDMNKYYLPY